ncbi:MAG: hypothetical protein ACI8Z5_001825, partial [Lentimonas sp.]
DKLDAYAIDMTIPKNDFKVALSNRRTNGQNY